MPEFRGLEDTAPVRKAYMFRTVAELMRLLRQNRACTAADDHGAINVYKDRYGRYRCDRYLFMSAKDRQSFTNLADVRKWTKAALKAIGK